MREAPTSETAVNPPPCATQEEWAAAWKMFNEGTKLLNRLAVQDGITLKLSVPTLGWVPRRGKKAKKS